MTGVHPWSTYVEVGSGTTENNFCYLLEYAEEMKSRDGQGVALGKRDAVTDRLPLLLEQKLKGKVDELHSQLGVIFKRSPALELLELPDADSRLRKNGGQKARKTITD